MTEPVSFNGHSTLRPLAIRQELYLRLLRFCALNLFLFLRLNDFLRLMIFDLMNFLSYPFFLGGRKGKDLQSWCAKVWHWHGIAVGANNSFSYFCEEHGYIFGLMTIMPKTAYQQGLPKHFSLNSPCTEEFMYLYSA